MQTESVGIEVRGLFPFSFVDISPQISLYPRFNNVHELQLGLSAQAHILKNKYTWYMLGHISYNRWYNYEYSPMEGAQLNNMIFDVGAGVMLNSCIRPFFEWRYNPFWQEANIRAGVLFNLACVTGKGAGGVYRAGKRKAVSCPGR
ncbi:MAG: hypothetical protein R6U95_08410 [Bacteroidales bacterium]